jgi:hypothetical protein
MYVIYETIFLYMPANEHRQHYHVGLPTTYVGKLCQLRTTVQCSNVVQTHSFYTNEYGRMYKTQSLKVSIHA